MALDMSKQSMASMMDNNSHELPGLIVEPEWLVTHLNQPNLRLLDVRLPEEYDEGHLPDAVWVDLQTLSRQVDGVGGMLLPPTEYAARLSQLGVDHDKIVVVYDSNWGMPAARVLWSLARYGQAQVAVLNGGWDRWQEAGYPIATDAFQPPSSTFETRSAAEHLAERQWILERTGNTDLVVIDTRTPNEYAQGHLPGAIAWDWMNGAAVDGWDAIRPADELRNELAELGITPDKEVVTYCRSGARAAHTYLLLRHLGFPRVRNYDGSWLEWSQYI